MKKVFYFSLSLLVIVLIFLGVYNFAFKNNVNNPSAGTKSEESKKEADKEGESAPLSASITNPINESILGATTSPDGALYYYSLDDQAFKKASLEGKDKSVLLSSLPGAPTRIIWSPKKDKSLVLLKQENGQSLWHSANITTKTLTPLKLEMSRLAWSNLGDKIFYQHTNGETGEKTLNIANPDGTEWKKLASVEKDSFLSAIPRSTSVSFWNKPSAFENTAFESVSFTGENRRTLLSEKFGADYLWSPDGEKVLVSTSENKGGNSVLLSIMNSSGGELQSLSLPTLISKVVWSQDSKILYYALPGSIPETAVMPDDYFGKPITTKDTFWKIDTATGKQSRLVDLKDMTQNMDSMDFFLSPNEDVLFFTERTTRKLYRIDL